MAVKSQCHRASSKPQFYLIVCFVTNIPACLALPLVILSSHKEIQSSSSALPKRFLRERHELWVEAIPDPHFARSL